MYVYNYRKYYPVFPFPSPPIFHLNVTWKETSVCWNFLSSKICDIFTGISSRKEIINNNDNFLLLLFFFFKALWKYWDEPLGVDLQHRHHPWLGTNYWWSLLLWVSRKSKQWQSLQGANSMKLKTIMGWICWKNLDRKEMIHGITENRAERGLEGHLVTILPRQGDNWKP